MLRRTLQASAAGLVAVATFGGCGAGADLLDLDASMVAPATTDDVVSLAVPAPGRFDGRTYEADVLVISSSALPRDVLADVKADKAVSRAASMSLFTLALEGRTLTVGSGSPDDLRAFSNRDLASETQAWRRLAAGSAIGAQDLDDLVSIALDASGTLPPADLVAAAQLDIPTDVVVNESWAAALQAPRGNALLVDIADGTSPEELAAELDRRSRGRWQVITLAGAEPQRPALLTGGAVAEAVGSFFYRPHEDGTITIDPAWVSQNITSTEVPILGRVTGHRVMLPQLYGAMRELEETGLGHLIRPEQYGGIFVPRFIGRDPSRPLSLHSWGIAIDLNVATNQMGTRGDMDPRVVSVMAEWGFAWGGTWSNPDPMHFELAALRSS